MTDSAVVPAGTQRRILVVLAAAQVLGGVGMATAIAVSTLLATRLSGSEAVGGTALTCVVIGTAGAALLLAWLTSRYGRRPALVAGYGIGALGGLGAALAIAGGSAAGMLLALVFVGAATAAGLSARFAATDLAEPAKRARALAMVVWAATVGSVAGPNLAGPVQDLAGRLGLIPDTGPFLMQALAFALAVALTWLGLRPDPLQFATAADRRPVRAVEVLRALRESPMALLGIGGVVLSHLLMIALMSMTPVHMDHGGAALQVVGLVISLHVAGMYALSPLFGWLADRLGRPVVLVLSALLLAGAGVACTFAGPQDTALLAVGLTLLGLGWSAGLIAGSTLLTESLPAAVRPGAQGVSDVTMNVSGALGGIVAGLVVAGSSFGVLSIATLVLTVPYLLAALVLRPTRQATAG